MKKSGFKFLITPNFSSPYDLRMVRGLADGLKETGNEALALPAPVSAEAVAGHCREYSIDVVIQINRTRSTEVTLPENVRFISWFQDVFPQTAEGFSERFHDSDILYGLGDPYVLGLRAKMPCYVGSLLCGVDKDVFSRKKAESDEKTDFSLCGFIPPPPRIRKIHKLIAETVEENYAPLNGGLDIHAIETAIRENLSGKMNDNPFGGHSVMEYIHRLKRVFKRYNDYGHHRLPPLERSINYYAREYPRLLDRKALIDNILEVSGSLELYGPGWNRHKRYKKYYRGIISTREGLSEVYAKTRMNLANNTHGLGLHSRTLECMAVGGFIFTHESPNDHRPGGMLTSFEPGRHYGVFNSENVREEAVRWLNSDRERIEAGKRASNIVRERHCWHHRARQIVEDLNR